MNPPIIIIDPFQTYYKLFNLGILFLYKLKQTAKIKANIIGIIVK